MNIDSGTPTNVTYIFSGVSALTLIIQFTVIEDVAPRVYFDVQSKSLDGQPRPERKWINTSCFSPAAVGSVADNSGINRLRLPGTNDWDMSLFKRINLKERSYVQLRLEAFNAFNHPQFASFNSTIVFNQAGQIINLPSQLGGTGVRFGFGALNATRPNSARILQIAAKFYF